MEEDKMTKWLIRLGLKLVSFDTLVATIASALAALIEYARTSSTEEGWDKAKGAVKKVKNWLVLFDEVYEDDTLTEEEEKKIQQAIADCTLTTSIYNLLKNKKAPRYEVWSRGNVTKTTKKFDGRKQNRKSAAPKKKSKKNNTTKKED